MKNHIVYLIVITTTFSCLSTNKVYYSKNINKTIHNLEQIENWLRQDYANGDIPEHIAQNYMLILRYSKCSLYKKLGEKTKEECFD